jgi:hypothetical protein
MYTQMQMLRETEEKRVKSPKSENENKKTTRGQGRGKKSIAKGFALRIFRCQRDAMSHKASDARLDDGGWVCEADFIFKLH